MLHIPNFPEPVRFLTPSFEFRLPARATPPIYAASAPTDVSGAPEVRRVQELEKELLRKDRALAEVTALLALKKKVREIWGDEDDDTPTKSAT